MTAIASGINRRGQIGLALLGVCFLALGGRLIHIQTVQAEQITEYRDARRHRQINLRPRRGLIVDTRGRILAGSEERPSVFADPSLIDKPEDAADRLAPVLSADPMHLHDLIHARRTRRFCWLARGVENDIAGEIRRMRLPGVRTVFEPHRFYPHADALAPVLGFVGAEGHGQEGLERYYNDTLSGTPGALHAVCDSGRRLLWSDTASSSEVENGLHLILTLDLYIQGVLDERLDRVLEQFQAPSGVGVVLDVNTGAVLALSSRPSFDLNDHRTIAPADPIKGNHALISPVEPGSVFKPFIMVGALAEKITSADEVIDCGQGFHYFGRRRIRDTHPNGKISASDIIVESSNIGMGILADRLGNDRLYDIVTAFGFGSPLGIDLPAEAGGIVLPTRRWSSYSKQSVAIGQELAVTPLQLACAGAALVNGGRLFQPHVVRAILDPDSGEIFERDPVFLRQVAPPEACRTVAQGMMRRMVEETHHDVQSKQFAILGKTGTAQVPDPARRGYKPDAYLASFLGAAPADDPQIVVVVMVREPKKSLGYYGGKVAGPAVRDVIDAVLTYRRGAAQVADATHALGEDPSTEQ